MPASLAQQDLQLLGRPVRLMNAWRPVRRDRNVRRFFQDATRLIDSLQRIADQRIDIKFCRAEPGSPIDHSGDRRFLDVMRSWMADAEMAYPRIERDLLRHLPTVAPRFMRLYAAAQRKTRELMAIYAFLLEQDDDDWLAFDFIPKPPNQKDPAPSLPLDLPEIRGDLEARCSETAAAQIAMMRARVEQDANSPHATLLRGIEHILEDLQDSELSAPNDAVAGDGTHLRLRAAKLGRARAMYWASRRAQVAVLLMLGCVSRKEQDELQNELERRIDAGEWREVGREIAMREQFYDLVGRWRAETTLSSSLDEIVSHRAYREIVALGQAVVPLILRELERAPDHWDAALTEITGQNPVPEERSGDLSAIRDAWLDWAEEAGINERG